MELIVRRSARIVSARTIDQHVARTKICQDLLMHLVKVLTIQYVCLICLCRSALCSDLVRNFLSGFLIQVENCHLAACCRQLLCEHTADRAACTCDNTNFTCQICIQHIFSHNAFLLYLIFLFSSNET